MAIMVQQQSLQLGSFFRVPDQVAESPSVQAKMDAEPAMQLDLVPCNATRRRSFRELPRRPVYVEEFGESLSVSAHTTAFECAAAKSCEAHDAMGSLHL